MLSLTNHAMDGKVLEGCFADPQRNRFGVNKCGVNFDNFAQSRFKFRQIPFGRKRRKISSLSSDCTYVEYNKLPLRTIDYVYFLFCFLMHSFKHSM